MQESHVKLEGRFKARPGITYELRCACGALYITCNNTPVNEVFLTLGKAGGCAAAITESIGKLISHYLQEGGDVNVILKSLSGVSCHQASSTVPSCISATVEAIKEHITKKED